MSKSIKDSIKEIKSTNDLMTVLSHYGVNYNQNGACCPFHNEKTPSFKINEENNEAYFKCFGCNESGDIINFIEKMEGLDTVQAIKKAYEILNKPCNLETSSKISKIEKLKNYIKTNNFYKLEGYHIEDIFIYMLDQETPSFLKVKYRSNTDKSKKDMRTYKIIDQGEYFKLTTKAIGGEYEHTIYNYPVVKNAIEKGFNVFFVEGEKDVESLKKLGLSATTIYSKKWNDKYTEQLQGARIVSIADTGQAGEEFQELVFEKLKDVVKSFKVVTLPGLEQLGDNADVTDWLETGKTKNDLINAVNMSLDLLNKYELQQDNHGIYQTRFKTDKETGDIEEIKDYITDFQILGAEIIRNEDNGDQVIKLKVKSSLGKVATLEGNARECFNDVKAFRKLLGIDYTFTKKMDELIKLHIWVKRYFIKKETINYAVTGIREVNEEYALVTNQGTLYKNGIFDTNLKALNPFHDIDFSNIDILTPDAANKLAKHLINFNSAINVYNTLGLGIANMLNSYVRESTKPNLPVLQNIGQSNAGKSKALNILNLLYNNTQTAINFDALTTFTVQKAFNDTFLPVFIDELKPSKSPYKVNLLSNAIRSITEGYTSFKGTKTQNINTYEVNASLILTGEEEINETAVKNRSNIVWYSTKNFTDEGEKAIEYLCETEEGNNALRSLSKSLYLYLLNNFDKDVLNERYDKVKDKYEELKEIKSSRERNTAIYTILGLEILYEVLGSLGVEDKNNITKEMFAAAVVENIQENVLDSEQGTTAEHEKVLELLDKSKLQEKVHYKYKDDEYLLLDIKSSWDTMTKYMKDHGIYESLISRQTFTKMITKSQYVPGEVSSDYYISTRLKNEEGKSRAVKTYKLKLSELEKLDMPNLAPRKEDDMQSQFEDVTNKYGNVIDMFK